MKISQLVLVLSLLGGGVYADPAPAPPQPPSSDAQVTFAAGLNIQVCIAGTCTLKAQISEVTLPLISVDGDPIHSRGYYTTVIQVDSLRYIGIVTVDRWNFVSGTSPQPPGSGGSTEPTPPPSVAPIYSFTVEILDAQGTSARMSVSMSNPDNLPSTTLSGRVTTVSGTEYTAMFSIGPGYVSGTCNDPRNPCAQAPAEPQTTKPQWNVMLGNLR